MVDIEKVITSLQYCSETPELNCDKQCPYGENGKKEAGACWVELNRDALSVIDGLKAELAELKSRHETIMKAADNMLAKLKERRWIPKMDREKVIKGIRNCLSHKPCTENGCPYENECAVEHLNDPLLRDALAMLKDQEIGHWIALENCSNAGVYCSECHAKVFDYYPIKKKLSYFCPHCGTRMEGEIERQ